MKTLLNIIWFFLAGVWLWILYVFAGLLCCLTIILIPFGIASFRIANYAVWPFGRTVVEKPSAGGASIVGNILWVILGGWYLALGHIVTAFLLAITIIGIPLAWANLKLVPVSLLPLGKEIVSDRELAVRRAQYGQVYGGGFPGYGGMTGGPGQGH